MSDSPVIAAVATALSPAGIAIIRMSGTLSVSIAETLFVAGNGQSVSEFLPRMLMLGTFSHGVLREQCLCVRFAAPHSYTGEDVVEFQIHGGVVLAEAVLSACIACGARLAGAGEFSRRAFLNGKLTLSQAEGVADTITAESEAELRASYTLLSGALSARIGALRTSLVEICSSVEVVIDYPEEDLEIATMSDIKRRLHIILAEIDSLCATYHTGAFVKNGLNIAIVGKPNVGKSSLLNRLLGYDRAIVTDIAGTTRDRLDETLSHKGVRYNFMDTAGLRQTDDRVEALGVERSWEAANSADCVLLLIDNTFGQEDRRILASLMRPPLLVLNKCELRIATPVTVDARVSCKMSLGLEELKDLIFARYFDERILLGGAFLTNARHYSCLFAAADAVRSALAAPAPELIPIDLRDALERLGSIDGAAVSEKITDDIFSKFCLGK